MDFGVHLPLTDLGEGVPTGGQPRAFTSAAAALGFATVSASDDLVWRRAWLDGPTTLASVLHAAGTMTP